MIKGHGSRNAQVDVALLTPSFAGGGLERVMLNLANGLAGAGVGVEVVALTATGEFRDQVAPEVGVVDLGAPRMARALWPLRRYLRRRAPRNLLTGLEHMNVGGLLANALAGGPTRVFVSTHKAFSTSVREAEFLRARLFSTPSVRLTYPFAQGIIAISEAMADDLAETARLPRERVKVLPNVAVTDEMLARAERPPSHPWLRDKTVPVLLGVGRLHEQKDFPNFLHAVKRVLQVRPVRAVILGEGEDRAALERLRDELGLQDAVDLPGFVNNPYAEMREASAFVLSSRYEGLPTVLIEAMAAGCPVVATHCPTGPDEILEDGKYGPLAPVGDPVALANAILQVLDAPPDRDFLRERAMNYHTDQVVARYRELFEV